MAVIDPKYAAVVAQAEALCARQREAYEAALVEREAQQQAWLNEQAARLRFLKQHDAAPLDVSAYDGWLAAFVANNGSLTHFVEGNFPRIRMMSQEITDLFMGSEIHVPQQGESLAEAYYGENVIWTIDTPIDLAQLPALTGEHALTLHLTQRAVENFSLTELRTLVETGKLGENEFYVDGEWLTVAGARIWSASADVIGAIPYVWNENVRNMLGKTVLL